MRARVCACMLFMSVQHWLLPLVPLTARRVFLTADVSVKHSLVEIVSIHRPRVVGSGRSEAQPPHGRMKVELQLPRRGGEQLSIYFSWRNNKRVCV